MFNWCAAVESGGRQGICAGVLPALPAPSGGSLEPSWLGNACLLVLVVGPLVQCATGSGVG